MSNLKEMLERSKIPGYMHGGIIRYVEEHIPPGEFLQAIFKNDLMRAFWTADENNEPIIKEYLQFFYNNIPQECWGSKENYENWITKN